MKHWKTIAEEFEYFVKDGTGSIKYENGRNRAQKIRIIRSRLFIFKCEKHLTVEYMYTASQKLLIFFLTFLIFL